MIHRLKSFTIKLYGGVATSQADKDFANKRAEVVKKELIAKGVPADKIAIDPATLQQITKATQRSI